MKTIFQILIALIVLTVCAQTGMTAFTNYQFQDAVHEALVFAPTASDTEITQTVLELAANRGLPVTVDDVTIRQVGPDLFVDVTYEAEVRLLPGIYHRKWRFNPSTSTRLMPGMRGSPVRPR